MFKNRSMRHSPTSTYRLYRVMWNTNILRHETHMIKCRRRIKIIQNKGSETILEKIKATYHFHLMLKRKKLVVG